MFYEIGWTSWFISLATFKYDWNFISETFSDCELQLYESLKKMSGEMALFYECFWCATL